MNYLVRLVCAAVRPVCPAWYALAAVAAGVLLVAPSASGQEAEPAAAAVDITLVDDHDEAEGGLPEYPLEIPDWQNWTFDGPFGTYNAAQLQRGLTVYRQVCGNCHGLERVAFRTLASESGPFMSEDQMRAVAAAYSIVDADTGERREGRPADYFPTPPFPSEPPDLSLMTKARGVGDGFRWILDLFTQYQEGGVDYVYALLTGYQQAPEDYELEPGVFYNPYFAAGEALSMPPPLRDGMSLYEDGTPETLEQYAADVGAFLMWSAEPTLVDRKRLGFQVMVFLIVFTGLAYFAKRQVWAKEH